MHLKLELTTAVSSQTHQFRNPLTRVRTPPPSKTARATAKPALPAEVAPRVNTSNARSHWPPVGPPEDAEEEGATGWEDASLA